MYFIFYVFVTDRTDPIFRFLIRSYMPTCLYRQFVITNTFEGGGLDRDGPGKRVGLIEFTKDGGICSPKVLERKVEKHK